MNRLLSKFHSTVKMVLFGIFSAKFFAHMYAYGLKIYQKICSKIPHFSNPSEFRKKSNEKALHLFVFAGEQSGDMHGGHLLKALKRQLPAALISGVGGPAMREQGIECILRMEDFEVMGFTDVIKALPKLWKNFYVVRDYILQSMPHVVILIDYPGFNLRLAKSLRKKGFSGKIVHYIAPTIWAHGKKRIQQMANTLDLLLTIFPFESNYFGGTSLKVEYVGNPLQEYISHYHYDNDWIKQTGITSKDHLIAIFPGSRKGEITRNLPAILNAMKKFKEDSPEAIFAISCASSEIMDLIRPLIASHNLKDVYLVPKVYSYEMMRDSRTAIAKSGTVTLELALHERPTVVVYKLTFLNWLFAKVFLRLQLPYYCIVNILKGDVVFPELIEHGYSAANIYSHLKSIDTEGSTRHSCLEGCRHVKELLKEDNVSERAANRIVELLS